MTPEIKRLHDRLVLSPGSTKRCSQNQGLTTRSDNKSRRELAGWVTKRGMPFRQPYQPRTHRTACPPSIVAPQAPCLLPRGSGEINEHRRRSWHDLIGARLSLFKIEIF